MIEIVNSVPAHVAQLARLLSDDDPSMATVPGKIPRRVLRDAYRESWYRRSALVDDELAGMWGIAGAMASHRGHVWLTFAPLARICPIWTMMRMVRRELAEMAETKPQLYTSVSSLDSCAIRFAKAAGFEPGEMIGYGVQLFRLGWG